MKKAIASGKRAGSERGGRKEREVISKYGIGEISLSPAELVEDPPNWARIN